MTNIALRPSSCFSTTEHKSLEVVEKKNSQLKIIIEKLKVFRNYYRKIKHMYFKIKIALMLIFSINLFASDLEIEKIFKNKEVEGTIIIESLNQKKTYVHNKFRADTFLSPASSFKIPHTLIALNEGVVSEDSIITWDKVVSPVESCNNDQTLKSALKNSCIWCYQEFASKIESSKYKEYLKQMDYGNKVVGNDIKNFWVDESLKINAFDKIKFLW